jgi:nicotinate-nucleotide adenylyltransferase
MRPSVAQALPAHAPRMRIGLLGGSFNPPHRAHRAISLFALKRLQLDRVWWLVTPGNPLKDTRSLHTLDERIAAARAMADDRRIAVTAVEDALGTRYTVDTLRALRLRCADVRFVWIMGADNLSQFDRWRDWRGIAAMMPLAVIDRPPLGGRALGSVAAQALGRFRIPERDAASLAERAPPAWAFLGGMKLDVSSTALRRPDGSWIT